MTILKKNWKFVKKIKKLEKNIIQKFIKKIKVLNKKMKILKKNVENFQRKKFAEIILKCQKSTLLINFTVFLV